MNLEKDKKYAALYIRVSTEDQTEYSPDSQIKLCYKYAKEHNITILENHIYRDDGISGRSIDKRLEFQRMIANAKKKPKPFDIILVYDFSRFARNRQDSIIYKALLRKQLGIDIISITQPLSNDNTSIISEAMLEAFDEYYSANLSQNSKRGKLEKAERGEHQGNPPYGYSYSKDLRQIIPNENKEIVKLIFNEWIKPESTIWSIVHMLNKMNIKCTRSDTWSRRVVLRIIQNPAYVGYNRFKLGGFKNNYNDPDIISKKGNWETFIDKKTWNLSQQKMKLYNDKWFKYKKDYSKQEHWLRGIIKCSNCGRSLVHIGTTYPHFQCTGYTHGKCNISHHVSDKLIIPAILDSIKGTFKSKTDIHISNAYIEDNNQEIDILNANLKKLESKRKRIKEAYINEIDSLEEYKDNKLKLDQEEKEIKEQIKNLNIEKVKEKKKEETYTLCETAYNILSDKNIDFTIKDEIAHQLFDKIIYNKNDKSIEIYYK